MPERMNEVRVHVSREHDRCGGSGCELCGEGRVDSSMALEQFVAMVASLLVEGPPPLTEMGKESQAMARSMGMSPARAAAAGRMADGFASLFGRPEPEPEPEPDPAPEDCAHLWDRCIHCGCTREEAIAGGTYYPTTLGGEPMPTKPNADGEPVAVPLMRTSAEPVGSSPPSIAHLDWLARERIRRRLGADAVMVRRGEPAENGDRIVVVTVETADRPPDSRRLDEAMLLTLVPDELVHQVAKCFDGRSTRPPREDDDPLTWPVGTRVLTIMAPNGRTIPQPGTIVDPPAESGPLVGRVFVRLDQGERLALGPGYVKRERRDRG